MSSEKLNLAQIRAALASAGDPWDAGVTSVSVLSDEQKRQRLGVRPPAGTPDPATVTRPTGEAARAASVGAPASFFWGLPESPNYVTPVKDQGGCGSCVGFGTVGVIESTVRIQRGNPALDVDLEHRTH